MTYEGGRDCVHSETQSETQSDCIRAVNEPSPRSMTWRSEAFGNQWSSVVISGHQWSSVVISGHHLAIRGLWSEDFGLEPTAAHVDVVVEPVDELHEDLARLARRGRPPSDARGWEEL